MGKFPGKPTRTSRKRISVIEDFKGFTRQEVETSIEVAKKEQEAINDLAVGLPSADRTNIDTKLSGPRPRPTSRPSSTKHNLHESFQQDVKAFSQLVESNEWCTQDLKPRPRPRPKSGRPRAGNRSKKRSFSTKSRLKPNEIRHIVVPTGRPRGRPRLNTQLLQSIGENPSLKKLMANKLLQKAKKSSNAHIMTPGTTSDVHQERGGAAGARKLFVFPRLSNHSSRVIKPTKRCLESEEVLNEPRSNQSLSLSTARRPSNQTGLGLVLKEPKLILASAKTGDHNNLTPGQQNTYNNCGNTVNILSAGTKFSGFDSTSKISSFQTAGTDSLSADGKGRWKPTYKVQLDLHELNVFGAGTSNFSEKHSRPSPIESRFNLSQGDGHQNNCTFSSGPGIKFSISHSSDTDGQRSTKVNDKESITSLEDKGHRSTKVDDKELINTFADKSESLIKPPIISRPSPSALPMSVSSPPPTTFPKPKKSLRPSKVFLREAVLPSVNPPAPTLPSPNKSLCSKVVLREAILPSASSPAPTLSSPNKSLGSKVVLREARLKLGSKVRINSGNDTTLAKDKSTVNAGMPGTVVCGVCGAVRFYKFVKQARKFGIFCCESCRKFISKMMGILKETVMSKLPVLNCFESGGGKEGSCKTVPIVRSHQWKSKSSAVELRSVYKARCPACWLKNCLHYFKMPELLHSRLSLMLPPKMQDIKAGSQSCEEIKTDVELQAAQSSKQDRAKLKKKNISYDTAVLGSKLKIDNDKTRLKQDRHKASRLIGHIEKQVQRRAKEKRGTASANDGSKENKVISRRSKECKVTSKKIVEKKVEPQKKKTTLQQQRALEKASKKLLKSSIKQVTRKGRKNNANDKSHVRKKHGTQHTSKLDSMRRQRLEMKGPRVKHVCRSASVVLGQPQAIFPKVEKMSTNTLPEAGVSSSTKKASKGSYCQDCDKNSKAQDCAHNNMESNQDTGTSKKASVTLADVAKNVSTASQVDEVPSSSTSRKVNKPTQAALPLARIMQIPRKLPHQEVRSLVSIDFWESYDPEEVSNSGFGLIGSEPFTTRAICFLCGSTGTEKLIHCASCCDPYHRFCLYDGLRDPTMSLKNSKDVWRLDWLCQRCTVCHTCGRGSGPQLSCQRCRRTYHTECLDSGMSRLHSPDRPWVCSACLRCNNCGETNVTQFVGNLPFCAPCLKLRKKGNFCPLCQKCYEDDDFDTKMMECGQCKCWVHASCEDISDEKYVVLGSLPDTIEFVCRTCCPLAPWRLAVEEELKAVLKGVIQVLVKKCKTWHLLSLSPKKECSCRPAVEAKRIRFPNLGEDVVSDEADKSVSKQAVSDIKVESDTYPDELETVAKNSNETSIDERQQIHTKEIGTGTDEKMEMGTDLENVLSSSMEIETDIAKVPTSSSKQPVVCFVKVDSESECKLPTYSVTGQETTDSIIKLNGSDLESDVKKVVSLEELNGPLKHLRDKYNLKDCSVYVEKLDKGTQHSDIDLEDKGVECLDSTFSDCSGRSPEKMNSSLTPTDSGIGSTDDELKLSIGKNIRVYAPLAEVDYSSSGTCEEPSADVQCKCFKVDYSRPTLLSMEQKIENNKFLSLTQFDEEMELLLNGPESLDLLNLYHRKLKDAFSYFHPKHAQISKVSCLREQQPDESTRDNIQNRNIQTSFDDVWVMPDYALGKSVDYYYSDFVVEDVRACTLCRRVGDGLPCEQGRLLYCGQNEWTHANCALWSSEVFEEIDGSLQNVHSAVFRGRKLSCESCGIKGASVGCCSRNCFVTFHFPCARESGCRFMEDKTFYCPAHMKEAIGKVVQNHEEFDLRRPIYVELDRKKKKFVEPDDVRFMIGSLHVERLGKVVPNASDHVDAIIPNEFSCTRLYWSAFEPWRIVQYTVKTVLPKIKCEPGIDQGKNVTINHEQDPWVVRHKLEEVNDWHRQLVMEPSDGTLCEARQACASQLDNEKIVREVMDYMLDAVCSRDVYENCLSDPQNAAELLPPELKDAIFEDLPHDLLDGISMQDIFPKMMNFEDCFNNDTITEGKEQLSEDAMLNSEVEENTKFSKADTNCLDTDIWFSDSKEVDGTFQSECIGKTEPRKISKELKRSHSEVISLPITKTIGRRSQKRSCSLTQICKDSPKRRKIQSGMTRSTDMTMDITIDKSHKLQELRLPDGVLVTLARSTTPVSTAPGPDPGDLKESSSNNSRHRQAEEGKENKCLSWHGRPRLAQLDGPAESSSSGSEGGSPLPPDEDEKPVRCSRCHSTYRTRVSYERHLPTCSNDFILSTSESDSETRSSEGDIKKEVEDIIGVQSGYEIILPERESVNNENIKLNTAEDNNTFIFSDVLQNNSSPPATFETQVIKQEPVIENETFEEPDKEVAIRSQPKAKYTYQRTGRPRGRQKGSMKHCTNIAARDNNVPVTMNLPLISQTQTLPPQPIVQPAVIVQQVPSTNMMPAYLESFQQQTGHSLQYIASIDIQSNAYNKPQYITNGLIPGTFQLQSSPDYSNLSLLPSVQIASQPTMLGTIIQQPTAAIQCGVVGQERLVLNGTPLEVYTDQSGGMFLANQPMYYGLETIVSNTVMSSSQYVSGMPGMVAASSSYSATTTQVYQTNKMEQLLDPTSGYVIVPNSHLPNTNLNPCPNPVPMSLPSHVPQPVAARSQPPNISRNPPWALASNASKCSSLTSNQHQVRPQIPTPIHRPRPCYMPNPPVPKTNFHTPTRLKANVSISCSSMSDRMSSFKYTNANTHTSKERIDSSNQVKQITPVQHVISNNLSRPTLSIVNPVSKDLKESMKLSRTSVVENISTPIHQRAAEPKIQPTEGSKSKTQPIKLVIQKSPQNGFYRISHNVPQNYTPKLTPKTPGKALNEDHKPSSQTKVVLPLADNVKNNKTSKPTKRRWQPKEKPANQPKPSPPCKMVYEVCSKDGFSCTSTSISEVWEKVFEAVQSARIQHKMPPLLRNPFNVNSRGLQMLGLNHNGLRYLVEQLPGVNRCVKYKPLHHELNPPVLDDDDVDTLPEENPSGCCRTEVFNSRAPYDLFSWLASRHRQPPKLITPADEQAVSNRRVSSTNLPMAMRFRHLKETSKEAVGVYRSHIHGRGLFCLRDIEAGEMVIEYAGEVIRSTLTDYREKLYNDKDIGCYMFRIDDHLVVDATMRGNAARFINHSCEPNCYSKVVDILGKKHILIFALRRIPQREELTYDYKFPFEDIKIPCTCGSRRCRKYLN